MLYIHFQNFATYSLYIFTDDKFIETYSHEYTNIKRENLQHDIHACIFYRTLVRSKFIFWKGAI